MPITKMVIPVAGFGTRMLPATKAIPKEMVPIVDRPVIHYLIEEAADSGIEEVILVNHPSKRAIEDYFKPNPDLERRLLEGGKHELLDEIRAIEKRVKISVVYQHEPLGNGHAILMAKDLVGNDPFVVAWGDDIFEGKEPRVKQMIEAYETHGGSVLACIQSTEDTFEAHCKRYGCVGGKAVSDSVYAIDTMIEKPTPEEAPSNLFSVGGYLFTPRIMELLAETRPGKSNEIWLADAIAKLLKEETVFGKVVTGNYWDIGSKVGFLKANIYFALQRDDTRDEILEFMKTVD